MRIVYLCVSANSCIVSIALQRLCQSLVFAEATRSLNSSRSMRSTGFETDVVRLLKVFWVPSKPDEDPWFDAAPLGIFKLLSIRFIWPPLPRRGILPIPVLPAGPLDPPRGKFWPGVAPELKKVCYMFETCCLVKPSDPEAPYPAELLYNLLLAPTAPYWVCLAPPSGLARILAP